MDFDTISIMPANVVSEQAIDMRGYKHLAVKLTGVVVGTRVRLYASIEDVVNDYKLIDVASIGVTYVNNTWLVMPDAIMPFGFIRVGLDDGAGVMQTQTVEISITAIKKE